MKPFFLLKDGVIMTNMRTEHEWDLAPEDFAAALTEAVYPVVLRQRPKCSWLDLELNLWKVLGQTIQALTDANPLLKLMLVNGIFSTCEKSVFEVNNHEQRTEDSHRDRSVAGDRRGNRESVCRTGFQRPMPIPAT